MGGNDSHIFQRRRFTAMTDTESRISAPVAPVRGRPFQKGNPGKKPGTRSHAARFLENMKAGDAKAIIAAMTAKAKSGNVLAAELLLSRLAPIPKQRRVAFNWPTNLSAEGIGVAFDAIMVGIGEGSIGPDEGLQIANILKMKAAIMETHELQKDIADLKAAIEKMQVPQ
jgi:hypothetical protein